MATRLTPEYTRYALHQIRIGRRTSMPGITRCPDCKQPYPGDGTGIRYCPTCRPNHDRICRECGTRFDGDTDGNRLCKSCRHQQRLF